jgi:hypothetical protein
MGMMTDQEADALDKKWTDDPPKVGANGTGFFAKRRVAHLIPADDLSAHYLMTKAAAENKTQRQVLSELVREHIGATT